jgi:EmrB/QacA subfamily drug resistance transporter
MPWGGPDPTRAPAQPAEATGAPRFGQILLIVMCSAQLLLAIDFNIVNIANPVIGKALHFHPGTLQWTVTAYGLTFGGFLLLGGRMADRYARRGLFIWGVTGFALTSIIAGIAQNSTELIAARAGQGLCAAVISPTVLALLASAFPEGRPRQRAYGMWALTGSIGGLTGLVVGGVITSVLGWRWIFFINAPIAVIVVVGALFVLPDSVGDLATRRRLDIPGAITVTLGIGLVIFGFGEAQSTSWASVSTLVSLCCSPVFLVVFYVIEKRTAEPLLPLSLLRGRTAVANLQAIFQQSAGSATLFLLPIFLQNVWGYSALQAGVATIFGPLGFAVGSRFASRFAERLGTTRLILAGFGCVAAGCLLFAQLPVHGNYTVNIVVPLVVRSLGQGLVVVSIALAATSGVAEGDQGIAAGLYNMSQQLGGAIGLAAIATIAAAVTTGHGGGVIGNAAGIRAAFWVTTLLPLSGAVLALWNSSFRTTPRFGASNRAARTVLSASDGTPAELAPTNSEPPSH